MLEGVLRIISVLKLHLLSSYLVRLMIRIGNPTQTTVHYYQIENGATSSSSELSVPPLMTLRRAPPVQPIQACSGSA